MNTSIKIGHFLFRRAYPVYNVIYPIFKRRQDKREISLIRTYLKEGDTVLDIGANIGFYTRIFSRAVGAKGKVFAFEPDRDNYGKLQKNIAGLTNVQPENKAVSAETGVIKIYISPMLNVDHRTYPVDDYESIEEIPCVALDRFLPAGQRVDFIKIDIQGFEVSAFRGMTALLARNPDIKIVSEFWPYGLAKAGSGSREFLEIFWNAGLKVFFVSATDLEPITPENLSRYDNPEPTAYMNIFVTRNL